MSKLQVGVIIGRFQVPELHAGHKRLFAEVAVHADVVVALLGVSPVDGYTAENPLAFNQRRHIVSQAFPNVAVFPLYDERTNEEWSLQIDRLVGGAYPDDEHEVTLYGGRGSFVDSYKGKYPTKQLKFDPPIPVAGTDNRAAIKQANSPDFYAGQIYALQRQFPHAYPTVDIALVRPVPKNYDEVLLIQRADSGRWCFPGGFVDPTDTCLETAAARELQEETGLVLANGAKGLRYLGSARVNDFRYRGSRDKIVTSFFLGCFFYGHPTPNYNEVQDYQWIDVFKALSVVSDTHLPLAEMLANVYRNQRSPGCTIKHEGPCNVACGEF